MNTALEKIAKALDVLAESSMPSKVSTFEEKVAKEALSPKSLEVASYYKEKTGSELPVEILSNPSVLEILSKVAKQEENSPPSPLGEPEEMVSGVSAPLTKEAAYKAAWDMFEETIFSLEATQ